MTLYVYIGRRVPRSAWRRGFKKIGGMLTFQENLWIIISQSLAKAKRKSKGHLVFTIMRYKENEDINYNIEWMKVVIQGDRKQELEEYEDSLKLYLPFSKIFKESWKKEQESNSDMVKQFKTKILSQAQLDKAYREGYGTLNDKNISDKLLEMGILTHIELQEDYVSRGLERA